MRGFSSSHRFCIVICTVLLGCCYQLQRTFQPISFVGMSELSWESNEGCLALDDEVKDLGNLKRTLTGPQAQGHGGVHCRSAWLQPLGNFLELEFTGKVAQGAGENVSITVESESHGILQQRRMTKRNGKKEWVLVGLPLPSNAPVRVSLDDTSPRSGWVSVRTRVNFYSDPFGLWKIRDVLRRHGIFEAVELLFAVALTACCLLLAYSENRIQRYSLYFLCAGFLIIRYNSFFFLDDWQFLERVEQYGWSSVFFTQNEHFIPVFAALLLLQIKLFSTEYLWYQLVGVAVHAGNALFLESLLQRLLGKTTTAVRVSRLAAFAFAVHGLHGEALQWLTTQSISLGMMCRFCAYLLAWNYVESGNRRMLYLLAGTSFLGPLIFGGTFSLPFEIALLLLAQYLLSRADSAASPEAIKSIEADALAMPRSIFRPIFLQSRYVITMLTVGVSLGIDVVLYVISKHGSGVALNEVTMPDLSLASRYLLLGSQYGTVFRGLGFDDSVYFYQFRRLLRVWPVEGLAFDQRASLAGSLVSAALFLAYLVLYRKQRRQQYSLVAIWLFAQSIIMFPFLMSVFARLRFGVIYALQGRYCTMTLPGVAILVAPLLVLLLRKLESWRIAETRNRYRLGMGLSLVLLCLFFNQSIDIASRYAAVSQRGHRERIFFEQVADWNRRLGRTTSSTPIPFDGSGTRLAGLYPLYFQSTQGMVATAGAPPKDPDRIYYLLTGARLGANP